MYVCKFPGDDKSKFKSEKKAFVESNSISNMKKAIPLWYDTCKLINPTKVSITKADESCFLFIEFETPGLTLTMKYPSQTHNKRLRWNLIWLLKAKA